MTVSSLPFQYKCEGSECSRNLSFGEFRYSISKLKKALCMRCQDKLRASRNE